MEGDINMQIASVVKKENEIRGDSAEDRGTENSAKMNMKSR